VGHAPYVEDIVLVRAYLVRCVETDVGMERAVGAVGVMRWWGAMLALGGVGACGQDGRGARAG
jgi:DNA repair protein REV1 C-terminal domain